MSGCAACSWEVQLEDTFCARCGAPVVDPLIGAVVGDRYRIVSRIGVGGMGAVYRAEHTMMRRDLAVKVLLPELGGQLEFARRFEREAESASRLTHPNIINVTDFGRAPTGQLFLAMEFLAGDSLSTLIGQGPLPRDRALAIARQMLRGLDHAHGAGVIHRDLKPDNIMLVERDGQSDVVKILDFGIAKVTEPVSGQTALTQAGVIFGTPEYLSPEQALGEPVDARADVYATGVILYEMLAGRRPFESDDKVKIISMHLAHAPPRMREINPALDIPPALEQVVLQALEKHREHRFASATAFLQALDESELGAEPQMPLEIGATVPHVIALPLSRVRALVTRHRRGSVAAAVGVGLICLGLGVFAVRARSGGNAALRGQPAQPVAPPPELASRLQKVESLLEAGNTVGARLSLEHELNERPKDARVRYMLGRVAFAENHHGEALGDYREAIELDPGFRGDAVMLQHLETALGEPRNADTALDLAVDKIGAPAAKLLEKVANESPDATRRLRTVGALDDMGRGDRIDRVSLAMLQLKKAQSCEERKVYVEKLRDLGDARALPALKSLRGRVIGRLIRVGGSNTSCMKKELAAAIKELETKS